MTTHRRGGRVTWWAFAVLAGLCIMVLGLARFKIGWPWEVALLVLLSTGLALGMGWSIWVFYRSNAERIETEEELKKHRDHLEELVGERTAELTMAIDQLEQQITMRRQAEKRIRQLNAELEQRVAELQRSNAELQVRNEDLDAFAHTAAHDLKSPLGPMVGLAHVLEKDYTELPDEDVRRYLGIIAQSGRKMGNIIDEMLLLAGVRKTEKLEMGPLDMGNIVAEGLDRLSHMIDEYQAEIIAPENWPVAVGYGPWVEEVWVNYLNNALRYGGQPPRVELGSTVQADTMIRFWVRDNGLGLTSEEQARLFTPFERLDQVRAKGHGLGLSIVRRIVEKLGGEVGVESQVGQGSVFSFTLFIHNHSG